MQLFKLKRAIDFMGMRKLAIALSATAILIAIASMAMRGMDLGIDFTGGTLIEVGYQQSADLSKVRDSLAAAGFQDATAQHFGTTREVLVNLAPRTDMSNAELSDQAFSALKQATEGEAELRRVEFVGPQVGDELTEDGGLAMLYALIGILIYVAMRFEYRFAVGSIVALVHDVVITMGIFSLFQIEFDLPVPGGCAGGDRLLPE